MEKAQQKLDFFDGLSCGIFPAAEDYSLLLRHSATANIEPVNERRSHSRRSKR